MPAHPWALPHKIQAAQEDVSHRGAAVCAKAEELSRGVCHRDVGLVWREAGTIPWSGMLPWRDPPEQWLMPCTVCWA